ncbi:hypothetical protein C5S29_06345 [ANME-1 cluster archaeon GoMg3.2]|nr:hypothetical protein [ANME-1 cluster archaeon GoMg3.2]
MGIKFLVLLVVALLVLQAAPVNASDIVVIRADTIQNVTTTYPSSIPDVTARIIVEYANSIYQFGLYAMPENLTNVAIKVMPRIIVEYANSISHPELEELPEELLNTTKEVSKRRLLIEYAESNTYLPLKFPIELMHDTIPPVIGDVSVINVTNNSAMITWRTDEFGDTVLKCGENSTVYTKMCMDDLFVKEHVVALKGLSPGTTYYFIVNSTDRSRNSAESLEYWFDTSGG